MCGNIWFGIFSVFTLAVNKSLSTCLFHIRVHILAPGDWFLILFQPFSLPSTRQKCKIFHNEKLSEYRGKKNSHIWNKKRSIGGGK